jgi:hypothetical protein
MKMKIIIIAILALGFMPAAFAQSSSMYPSGASSRYMISIHKDYKIRSLKWQAIHDAAAKKGAESLSKH